MLLGRLCTSSEARHVGLTASCWDAHAYNHQQWENQGMFKKQAPKCLCSLLSTLLIPPFARIKGSWKQPKPSSISSSTQQKLSELPCSMERLTTPTSEDRWHSRLETLKCALKHSAGVVPWVLELSQRWNFWPIANPKKGVKYQKFIVREWNCQCHFSQLCTERFHLQLWFDWINIVGKQVPHGFYKMFWFHIVEVL